MSLAAFQVWAVGIVSILIFFDYNAKFVQQNNWPLSVVGQLPATRIATLRWVCRHYSSFQLPATCPAGVPVDTGMFWEPVRASRRRFRFLGQAGRLFNCKPSRPLPAYKGKREEEKYRAESRVIVPKNEAVCYKSYLLINHRHDGLDELYNYVCRRDFAGAEREYKLGAVFEIDCVAALSRHFK